MLYYIIMSKFLEHPKFDRKSEKYNVAVNPINAMFKAYQLKDLIQQYVNETGKKIKFKTLPKKQLIELYLYYNIGNKNYYTLEANPIKKIDANVLKKYGLVKYKPNSEAQEELIEFNQKQNPLKSITGNITLQTHQRKFIEQFIFSQLRGAVVFHGVGSGKTLTAVVAAYFYLQIYPNNKVIVISPSALLYNFINGMQQYGINLQDSRYEFMTYDKYIRKPIVAKNSLLIIDEAHNFRTEFNKQIILDPETQEVLDTTVSSNKRGYKIWQYGAMHAHKIILLTGTAFVNKIYDIENLLAFVDQRETLDSSTFYNIIASKDNLSEYFGNRISYVPPLKNEFFPEVRPKITPIYMTDKEQQKYKSLKNEGPPYSTSENPNSFFSAERYATNMINKLDNPKIKFIMNLIKEKPLQKFIIYTASVNAGLNLLQSKLKDIGVDFKTISGNESTIKKEEAKKYYNGYFNKNIKASNDPALKSYLNNKYRVLLITKAGAEGVDTKNSQNLVMLDHQWNEATTEQIVARAVRYKSHEGLPSNDRYVNVWTLLFVFKENEDIIKKIQNPQFNDWINVKNELTASSDEYKELMKTKKAIYAKGKKIYDKYEMKIPKNKNEFIRNINLALNEYYKFIINKLPQYKDKFKELELELNKLTSNVLMNYVFEGDFIRRIKSKDKYEETIKNFYHKYLQQRLISSIDEANDFDRITESSFNVEHTMMNNVVPIDLYLFLLAKSKLKNINEFISKFKVDIPLFEEYQEGLLPIIKANEEAYVKSHGKLTDKAQINIYSKVLEFEKDNIKKLAHNFAPDLKDIMKKAGTNESRLQQYFTGEILAKEIIKAGISKLQAKDISILEPTAGMGYLVEPLKDMDGEYDVDMIELDEKNRLKLKELVNIAPNIYSLLPQKNFLIFGSSKKYDLILMNPPFHLKKGGNGLIEDVWDYDFIYRAFTFLKIEGRMMIITSTRWSFDAKFDEFDIFNIDTKRDETNFTMNKNREMSGKSKFLEYSIRRQSEKFIGSEGKKLSARDIDIWEIEKLDDSKDNEILKKVFYLKQNDKAQALEDVEIDFNKEQKMKDPPLPVPAPFNEILKEVQSVKIEKNKKTNVKEINKKLDEIEKKIKQNASKKPEPESIEKVSSTLQQLLFKSKLDDIRKALVNLKFKGKIQTNPMLRNLQILQNFNTIDKMKSLIKELSK